MKNTPRFIVKALSLTPLLFMAFFVIFLTSCTGFSKELKLANGNWYPEVKTKLEQLISENSGKNKKVIFDFDNTIICRDIGEATFAAMVKEKKLISTRVSKEISPSFRYKEEVHSLTTSRDLTEYYENFLSMSSHQQDEQTPYSNAYAWVVQIMSGMSLDEILYFTEKAFAEGIAQKDSEDPELEETKINGYRQPFFYPEMVDLIGLLLKLDYDVYVVSASNVWSVRWMVTKQLNPLLQKSFGKGVKILPEHVIGVSVLLRDKRNGQLYKDPLLVRTNKAYAGMDQKELGHYELTSQIVYPLTGYYGKVANLLQYVSMDRPFLIAGDSPNDHPMLNWAENRLWLTRLEKMNYQEKTVRQIKKSLPGNWMLQPVLYKKSPGFVSNKKQLKNRLKNSCSVLNERESVINYLKKSQLIEKF